MGTKRKAEHLENKGIPPMRFFLKNFYGFPEMEPEILVVEVHFCFEKFAPRRYQCTGTIGWLSAINTDDILTILINEMRFDNALQTEATWDGDKIVIDHHFEERVEIILAYFLGPDDTAFRGFSFKERTEIIGIAFFNPSFFD